LRRVPRRSGRRHWLAADAGGIVAGAVLVDGVVGCSGGAAGRFSHPASAAKTTTNRPGIASLDRFMVQAPESERMMRSQWVAPAH